MLVIQHGLLPGQVLQRLRRRGATALLRGTASHNGEVRARITSRGRPLRGWHRRNVGVARCGRFRAHLTGIPVGGPYELTLSVGKDSLRIPGIHVGDVWILAGQSNMEGVGRLKGAPRPHPRVHACYMDGRWGLACEPIHVLGESPDPVHCGERPLPPREIRRLRARAVTGVGPGLFFGREMARRTGGVPQGVICTAHGGTSMSQWDPALKRLGGRSLYGSLLRAVRATGQPVAGVLWYQGESDADAINAPLYGERMRRLVAALRHDLRQPRLPFLLAQLARVFGSGFETGRGARIWNLIQEQQRRLKETIPFLECVATVDLPLDDPIHLACDAQARLGVRFARAADRLVHGNLREPPPPDFDTIRPLPSPSPGVATWEVRFRNNVGALRGHESPGGFALVDDRGEDTQFLFRSRLQGNRVVIETLMDQPFGFQLMYGHGLTPHATLADARDMAVPVFGPVPVEPGLALSPFVRSWRVSAIQPATRPLGALSPPKPRRAFRLTTRLFPHPLVDMHPEWEGHDGRVFFFTELSSPEDMRVLLRVGSDGPIRAWLDDRPVLADLLATNPALLDKQVRPVFLREGRHRLAVAMDLNGGQAWGFYLRFSRPGVSRGRILRGEFKVPVCSLPAAS